ncbi:MAG: hypothetical protein KKG76_03525 [Euryarchaeota archaeon]|nr:hypothetical protein [Euryarchaeota archaeon]MBU4076617.1 hypothetical protein [Euryarchaeota archaeon]
MSNYFTNQLRGYPVVLAALQAYSKDICRNCIGQEGSQTKVKKGLKKLSIDLKGSSMPEEEKGALLAHIDSLSSEAEAIELSEDCECQKTAGNCKIGTGCFPLGALNILKLITEPGAP